MSDELLSAVGLLRDYLLGDEAVTALAGDRIAHKSPEESKRKDPWVRITQLDARNETGNTRVEHLVNYYVQIDSFAGAANRFTEAEDLNKAVRTALVRLPEVDLPDAVVTDVAVASNPALADDDQKPARERFILEAEIWAHAK